MDSQHTHQCWIHNQFLKKDKSLFYDVFQKSWEIIKVECNIHSHYLDFPRNKPHQPHNVKAVCIHISTTLFGERNFAEWFELVKSNNSLYERGNTFANIDKFENKETLRHRNDRAHNDEWWIIWLYHRIAKFLLLPKNAQEVRANAIMKRGLDFFIEHLGLYRLDSSALEMELAFIRISIAYTREKKELFEFKWGG
jgi:hypothetical protein